MSPTTVLGGPPEPSPQQPQASGTTPQLSLDPGYPSVTQFQALNRLLQRRTFGEELCQIGHNAYQTQIAQEATVYRGYVGSRER